MRTTVPDERIRTVNAGQVNGRGRYVLYWMVASRRARFNYALERAVDYALELRLPLVVLEPLRLDYPWASERFHRFMVDGMADNARAFARTGATYYPYVERSAGEGAGLLAALAASAAVVVTDDAPLFFLPRMLARAATVVPVRMEAIDSCGIYPFRDTQRVFTTAASFRRHLQKVIVPHLSRFPRPNPLARKKLAAAPPIGDVIRQRWAPVSAAELSDRGWLRSLPIDQRVTATSAVGGARAAGALLESFVERLPSYASDRNQPSARAQSFLSPYLHAGHVSPHEIFRAVTGAEGWTPASIADRATGSRAGWWGASEDAEAFLDQLLTWRELGTNMAAHHPRYTAYESLPPWALTTLADHAGDERLYVYSLATLEAAETHDPVWNAAQVQLVEEGTIQNYLRMLWGKKILEWSPSPLAALEAMVELNNKYALDGRDPNSYSGIFWVLGRYDRAWGPERPIFGKVRYMSSESARRKLDLSGYLSRYQAA